MLRTWAIYFLTLISTFIFFLFYKMWVSWYCLIALLLVPVFALIVAVVSSLTLKVKTEAPCATIKGKPVYIKLKVEGIASVFSFYKLKMTITDHMAGTKKKEAITIYDNGVTSLPLETEHCERIRISSGKSKFMTSWAFSISAQILTRTSNFSLSRRRRCRDICLTCTALRQKI